MFKKYLKISLIFLILSLAFALHQSNRFVRFNRRLNYELLSNFVCAVAKDEFEKHPEMRTIALTELENNFPSNFSRQILKCLPNQVAKVIINPHSHFDYNSTLMLSKESMIIYVADKIEKVKKVSRTLIF